MSYKPVSHEDFEKKAFAIPGVLEGYNDLEEEFAMIAELIRAPNRCVLHNQRLLVSKLVLAKNVIHQH
jgi:hypothetical protein